MTSNHSKFIKWGTKLKLTTFLTLSMYYFLQLSFVSTHLQYLSFTLFKYLCKYLHMFNKEMEEFWHNSGRKCSLDNNNDNNVGNNNIHEKAGISNSRHINWCVTFITDVSFKTPPLSKKRVYTILKLRRRYTLRSSSFLYLYWSKSIVVPTHMNPLCRLVHSYKSKCAPYTLLIYSIQLSCT